MFSLNKNFSKFFSEKISKQTKKFKKEMENYKLKDFTKNYSAKQWISKKIEERKQKLPKEKISFILNKKTFTKQNFQPYFMYDKKNYNKYVRSQTMKNLQMVEDNDIAYLSQNLFIKDHTAQVLENYRRIRENKIFNKKLHEINEKKLSLKLEGRKIHNLIDNYQNSFSGYESFNNTQAFQFKEYGLSSFLPLSSFRYAGSLDVRNDMYEDKVNSSVIQNKYIEYKNNKNLLENKRIESLLKDNSRNEALSRFLEDSNFKLIGNNELSLVTENENRVSTIKPFSEHVDLSYKINQYELEIYNEFKKLDLYNKYNKGIIEFKDLSIDENLNYIKFNLKNSTELFKMYNEVKDLDPIIICSLVQKLSIGYKEESEKIRLFQNLDYKQMLVTIKKNLSKLDSKSVIDTIYAIGKLHRTNRTFYPLFFQHLLLDFFSEINNRINTIGIIELSFLCEGIQFLNVNHRNDDLKVVEVEYNLAQSILDKLLNHPCIVLHPYHASKILYFYFKNNEDRIELLLEHLTPSLMTYFEEKQELLIDILDVKDLIKLITVYSWSLINNRSTSNKNILVKDIVSKYIEIMDLFSSIILPNRNKYEIRHASNIIYNYSNANIFNDELFRILQLQIDQELTATKEFKIEDVMYYTWGISKYYMRNVFPNFNNDINCIIYPNLCEKNNSHKFISIKKFKRYMHEREKMFNIKNLSLVVYSASLMGYSDIDFYLPIYHNIISTDGKIALTLENIGYLMQTLSLLNYNEEKFIEYFLTKLDKIYTKNIFSLSQILTSIVNLNAKKYFRGINDWEKLIEDLIKFGNINISEPKYAISFLWFFTYMDKFEESFFKKFYQYIQSNNNLLSRFDRILMNQIIIYNYVKYNFHPECITKEYLKELNQSSLNFEKERLDMQLKISQDKYETETLNKRVKRILFENKNKFQKYGFGYEEDVKIFESYIIPILFEKNKKCIFIYDHSERLKGRSLNGYNMMIQEIIWEKGYTIVNLFANEEMNDMKLLEYIIDKIIK